MQSAEEGRDETSSQNRKEENRKLSQRVEKFDRRGFIRKIAGLTALAGLGGLALERLLGRDAIPTARATDGDPLIIGRVNGATSETFLQSDSQTAFGARALAGGIGVEGSVLGTTGTGVRGFAFGTSGTGVLGEASASSGATDGVAGVSSSTSGTGVAGVAGASSGVTRGVLAKSVSPEGIGLEAFNANSTGIGLRVSNGRSQFVTMRDGIIAAGRRSLTIGDSRVNANSQVIVMLMGDPGKGKGVSWVDVSAGSFTVNLIHAASNPVLFRAFIAEKVA